ERPRSRSERLSDVAKAQNAERLARELWPRWRWSCRNGPLALPMAAPELAIDAGKATLQRDHDADDVFGDPDFVAVSIGQARSWTQCGALDAIKARSWHLNEFEAGAGIGHLLRETHGDQHVDVTQPRYDACLVIRNHLAGN